MGESNTLKYVKTGRFEVLGLSSEQDAQALPPIPFRRTGVCVCMYLFNRNRLLNGTRNGCGSELNRPPIPKSTHKILSHTAFLSLLSRQPQQQQPQRRLQQQQLQKRPSPSKTRTKNNPTTTKRLPSLPPPSRRRKQKKKSLGRTRCNKITIAFVVSVKSA